MTYILQPKLFKKTAGIQGRSRFVLNLYLKCRLIVLFLILSNFQLYATAFSQTVTINKKNVPIDEVLRDIRKQTSYEFIYNSDIISQKKKIDINVVNAAVTDVLNQCLADLPVTFSISGKTIMIREQKSY